MNKEIIVPVWEKMNLTFEEAAEYSGIGINKLRDLGKETSCPFILYIGNKKLIKRKLFEKYIENQTQL
ncbi:MAG: transposase [Lachnospiraceae bacterium]|nr:transposase [Lachnospiraceae bacterium]